ncbi:MAG: hypothetical protein ABL967_14240 [Bryobacteraceae bacterium]
MLLRTAFFLIPVMLLAQGPAADSPKPPADVDSALRARAKEFLQYNVDGNYRKAYDMVAEDSRDFYFGMAKPKYSMFEISDVAFSENFTKALVKGTVKRPVPFMGQNVEMPMPISDSWKLESGKWMWVQPQTKTVSTPMGEVPIPTASTTTDGTQLPKDMGQDAAMAAAKDLKVSTSVDKKEVNFAKGTEATQEVTFHNGLNGFVRVIATSLMDGGLFKAEPATATVEGNQDQKFTIHYFPGGGPPTGRPVLRLTIEPFQQLLFVELNVVDPAK